MKSAEKTSPPGGSGPESGAGLWEWLKERLSQPWWAGLGVILATAVALAIYFLGSDGSSSYSDHGNCNAQGNGNRVTCTSTGPGAGR